MASKQADTFGYFEFGKRAFAPLGKFNALTVRNIEQLARFQYELTGDYLQAALDQLGVVTESRDLGTLASRQAEIANRFADKVSKRSHELVKLATDSQTQFAKWVEDAAVTARKAA